MAISFGPKLNLLYNSLIGESYFDSLRLFLQSIDALVQGSVINATQISPPTSPNPGDAYLLIGGTPGGAWTGQAGNIAVWDAQLTSSGTNNVVPGWIFLVPKAGWVIWNVALGNLVVFNGSAWVSLTGGANFPTNTNITSMTGIPNMTLGSGGIAYNDSTNPPVYIGEVTTGGAGPNGFQWGVGTFAAPVSGQSTVIIGDGPWSGLDATGAGVGVVAYEGGSTVMTAGGIQTDGDVSAGDIAALTSMESWGTLSIGAGGAGEVGEIVARGSSNNSLLLTGASVTGLVSVMIGSGTGGTPVNNTGLLGFASNYPTQTTVGSAGGASALPATPTGYLQIAINGTEYVIPYYAHA